MDEELKKLEEALDELRKAMDRRDKNLYARQLLTHKNVNNLHMTERVIGKVEDIRDVPNGINVRCLCVPSGAERHSGRYPWKDDDNEIREVFKMDSNRLNRFVSMINAAGGNFRIEDAIGTRPTVHIDIPSDMLYHLHIDGDGSIGLLKKIIAPKIPDICNIQTFNDRAIQITFADGTQTRCVCGKDETFDLYEGIAFCLFKRFLDKEPGQGHKQFNNLMHYAMKKLDEQEKAKEREAEIEAEKKRVQEKKKLQAERRKARKREEQIGIYQEAMKRDRDAVTCNVPNPYFAPGEHEPPIEPDEKNDDGKDTTFFDTLSGREFASSKEAVILAAERLNNEILSRYWVSVNEWYEELGLEGIGWLGEQIGWSINHTIKIDFAPVIVNDNPNCLNIVYIEKPVSFGEGVE